MLFEPDHFLLPRDHAARDQGDLELAAQAWEQLIVNNFDRIKGVVAAFRFSGASPGIPAHDQGSAATEAYLRAISMGGNFAGRHIGQFYAALHTCVKNACMDFGRGELRHDKHSAGSADETFDPDGETGRFDAALAAYDAELRERAIDAVNSELHHQETEQLVAWAISQVQNDNYREVLELTYIQKLSAQEISDQLGISMANVYQRRSRGVTELEKILRDFGN